MKALRIKKSLIRVVSLGDRLNFYLRVEGILPGCRKCRPLICTPASGYIWVRPLIGHSGTARISLAAWRELILKAPVVSDTVEITQEIESQARTYQLNKFECGVLCVELDELVRI